MFWGIMLPQLHFFPHSCGLKKCLLPLAKSSSSFLFVEVDGSFATKAGLAFACSAACG